MTSLATCTLPPLWRPISAQEDLHRNPTEIRQKPWFATERLITLRLRSSMSHLQTLSVVNFHFTCALRCTSVPPPQTYLMPSPHLLESLPHFFRKPPRQTIFPQSVDTTCATRNRLFHTAGWTCQTQCKKLCCVQPQLMTCVCAFSLVRRVQHRIRILKNAKKLSPIAIFRLVTVVLHTLGFRTSPGNLLPKRPPPTLIASLVPVPYFHRVYFVNVCA